MRLYLVTFHHWVKNSCVCVYIPSSCAGPCCYTLHQTVQFKIMLYFSFFLTTYKFIYSNLAELTQYLYILFPAGGKKRWGCYIQHIGSESNVWMICICLAICVIVFSFLMKRLKIRCLLLFSLFFIWLFEVFCVSSHNYTAFEIKTDLTIYFKNPQKADVNLHQKFNG